MSGIAGPVDILDTRVGAAGMSGGNQALLVRDPKFQELVRKRNRLAGTLSVIILGIYSVFIGLVAFDKPFLAIKVAGTTSVGIVLGLVVIVAAFLLTAIYVIRANGRFDDLTGQLVQEYGK